VTLPLLVVVMTVTAAGAGMWLTALAVQFRDVRFGMVFGIQLLMYVSPVIYPTSMIPDRYRLVYGLNPMTGVIEGFRSALLGTNPMPWDLLAVSGAAAVAVGVSGAMYFRRMERVFADVV
jgi:lipopolysaccharide transport system permease protein